MKQILFCVLCLSVLISNGQKLPVSASPYPISVKQPDGTRLILFAKGDEFRHYPVTEDGYTVVKNTNGIYEYAELGSNGELYPTGMAARNISDRRINERQFLLGYKKNIKPDKVIPEERLKSDGIQKVFPSTGTRKTLLLMIKYPDLNSTYTTGNFNNLMNQVNYSGTGSMHDYFLACSSNNLNLSIDVFGWYTAAHDHTYYGDNQPDSRSQELVSEAIDAAEAAGVDFSVYDNDGDGIVENVLVVHSGPGAEEGSQKEYVWSHSWNLASYKRYDGVRLYKYIIMPETRSSGTTMVGIGVFCHEFGHALGLPDLYDTSDESEGLGNWCLMSSGSWLNNERTPALMSAWCREELGWITPTVFPWPITSANTGNYTLQPAATSTQCYKILTQKSNEYFLLENKYKTGFNASLPGSGLAIFHINSTQPDNSNVNLKLVDLEEADGLRDLDNNVNRGDAGDVYPGSTINRVFDDFSNPNAKTYDPQATGINILNIALNGSVIDFSINTAVVPGPNLTYDAGYNSLAITGSSISVGLRVKNTGNQSASAFTVGYYLSTTLPVTSSGISIGSSTVSSISAGNYSNVSFTTDVSTIPSVPAGNYYIGYVIDNTNIITETDETDNSFSFTGQQFNYNLRPNLTFTPVANNLYINNKNISVSLNVKNDGTSSSGVCSIAYYLSVDQIITTSDILISSDLISVLTAGQSITKSMTVDISTTLPNLQSGHYYVGYIIDYLNNVNESNETDNTWCFTTPVFNYCKENLTRYNASICSGEIYSFNGTNYSTQGQYTFTYPGYNGCDSVIVFNLTVNQPSNTVLNKVICSGSSYQVGNNIYSTAGTYIVHLKNMYGCDSTITLNLQIRQPQVRNLYRYICQGNSVKVGPYTYTQTGDYTAVFADQYGCDSTIIMHLTVNPVTDTLITKTICHGEYLWIGNKSYSSAGIYKDTLTNQFGCDSLITLNLTVTSKKEILLSRTICQGDSILMGGNYYKLSGIYQKTLVSTTGCDSIITLDLKVNPTSHTNLADTICEGESYLLAGEQYFNSGTYSKTLQNRFGCDSVLTLKLTVIPAHDSIIHKEICSGDSVVIGNSAYKTTGVYEKTLVNQGGCSFKVRLYLNVNQVNTTNLNRIICEGDSVVIGNISYKTTGRYINELTNRLGCDSIVNLNLVVNPVSRTLLTKTICKGESFTVGSKVYNTTGVYINYLKNRFGCDSIVTLDLHVNPVNETNLNYSVCKGDSVVIGSMVYKTTGIYTLVFVNRLGCDSIVKLNLIVRPTYNLMDTRIICGGDSVRVGRSIYKTNGLYKDTLVSSYGCDSVITTQVIVKPTYNIVYNESICQGESIKIGSTSYTTSGTYYQTFTNQYGCDSLITLYLRVNQPSQLLLSDTICEGESFVMGGNIYKSTGIYTKTMVNRNGCDSIVTLNLTVRPVSRTKLDVEICHGETYILGQDIYSESGSYNATFVNRFGCDSVVTLNLTILGPIKTILTQSICPGGSVTIGTQKYDQPGIYSKTLTSYKGCDSIVVLDLKLKPGNQLEFFESICSGEHFHFGNINLTATGIYKNTFTNQFGCDSVITLHLTVLPTSDTLLVVEIQDGDSIVIGQSVYKLTGIYTKTLKNYAGCDSIITLRLSVKDKIPDAVNELGANTKYPMFSVYPNPTNRYVNIELFNLSGEYRIKLVSMDGKTMLEKKGQANGNLLEHLELKNLSNGIYSVIIESGGRKESKMLVIKN